MLKAYSSWQISVDKKMPTAIFNSHFNYCAEKKGGLVNISFIDHNHLTMVPFSNSYYLILNKK